MYENWCMDLYDKHFRCMEVNPGYFQKCPKKNENSNIKKSLRRFEMKSIGRFQRRYLSLLIKAKFSFLISFDIADTKTEQFMLVYPCCASSLQLAQC